MREWTRARTRTAGREGLNRERKREGGRNKESKEVKTDSAVKAAAETAHASGRCFSQ